MNTTNEKETLKQADYLHSRGLDEGDPKKLRQAAELYQQIGRDYKAFVCIGQAEIFEKDEAQV